MVEADEAMVGVVVVDEAPKTDDSKAGELEAADVVVAVVASVADGIGAVVSVTCPDGADMDASRERKSLSSAPLAADVWPEDDDDNDDDVAAAAAAEVGAVVCDMAATVLDAC